MSTDKLPEELRKQAIDWLFLENSAVCSPADKQALAQWLAASPEHLQAYALVKTQMQTLRQLQHRTFPAKTAALGYRPATRHSRWRYPAAVLVLLAIGVTTFHPDGLLGYTTTFHTAKGQRRSISLADGSSIELNTDTELSVHYNRWQRQIKLTRGEAFFKVVHAAERPFDVQIGRYHVRDIGTAFNIYQQNDRILVSVQEGSVAVQAKETRELQAGQSVAVDFAGQLQTLAAADQAGFSAWRNGEIRFRNHRLEEVLREISRYHDVQISAIDPELAR